MNERIKEKIEEIENYLAELEDEIPDKLEIYIKNRKKQLICERLFEIILEAIVDLTFLIIKEKNIDIPEDDYSAFDMLTKNKIVSEEIGEELKEARRMRNIIAHKYGDIDNSIVFKTVKEELPEDIEKFIAEIKGNL